MKIIYPDIIEYEFILKEMCEGRNLFQLPFDCESVSGDLEEFEEDIMFLPTPLALKKTDRYVFLETGGIFSYFTGPSIVKTVRDFSKVYVRKGDHICYYYGTMLMKDMEFEVGEGEPSITEPARILEYYNPNTEKIDLYERWGESSDYLPMPLYSGLLRNDLVGIKDKVEKSILSSIRYSLHNFAFVLDEIYKEKQTSRPDISKMIVLQYVNKRTMQMEEEEREAIRFLWKMMVENGYDIPEPRF
ncbi:MAG: hypothetical protein M1526_05150 [Candidatus Thermoplasmatota archaeon]|nr:hypothetical protein [Candidatus Thermoplasmatota archaeon]MCL5681312.1 hypothetical protein [Candidatus Thermoplasmatota archaeon]